MFSTRTISYFLLDWTMRRIVPYRRTFSPLSRREWHGAGTGTRNGMVEGLAGIVMGDTVSVRGISNTRGTCGTGTVYDVTK